MEIQRRTGRWILAREPLVLTCLLVLAAAGWAFVELADEVLEGDALHFDEQIVLAMRNPDDLSQTIGPPWVQEMGRDATALGGVGWLVFCTASVVGFLLLDQKYRMAVFVAGAVSSGWMLAYLLKAFIARPRPEIVPHLSHVFTSSFPSGHSMLSAIVYLTLGSLAAAAMRRPRLKIYVLCLAVIVTLLVGVSRVYLGVHYPTDVLAGWAAGTFWALLCWLIARWLQQHGGVEPEPLEREPQEREQ
ncbi:phosphatidylglycerophosphatase B [Lignipirellula cremea]|uniref:Phosphatidylglycerophosphatase B n=2 Tax=Lignipirellula cremea TaxID=2528010 RepID=A0A518DNW6_9BACT|nr:phosphatidylglycerophosphatase B [Lignipirellula cremea]